MRTNIRLIGIRKTPNCKKVYKANDPACQEMQHQKQIYLAMREILSSFSQAEHCSPCFANPCDQLYEEMSGGSASRAPRVISTKKHLFATETTETTRGATKILPMPRIVHGLSHFCERSSSPKFESIHGWHISNVSTSTNNWLKCPRTSCKSSLITNNHKKKHEYMTRTWTFSCWIVEDFNGHHSTWDSSSPYYSKRNAGPQDSTLILFIHDSATCTTISIVRVALVDISLTLGWASS